MRILSLSGGGFQDYYTALMLARFEEERGPLLDHFDLFVGTSAGAMIAAAASVGKPMHEICEVFRREGPKIFSDRPAPSGAVAIARDITRYVKNAKYDGKRLRAVVSALAGDRTMADSKAGILVTAVRMRDAEPVYFSDALTPDVLLSDAVMASSAAPMMFPAHPVNGDLYADGALFANTPDLVALDYVTSKMGVNVSDVVMLSVGGMNLCPPLREPVTPNLGIVGWVQENRIFRTLIGAQAKMAENAARNVLGDRYVRVDAPANFDKRNEVALDVANDAAAQAAVAAAEMTYPQIVSCLMEHLSPPTVRMGNEP